MNKEVVSNKEKILLFIPMYNCEKQIVRVLDQIDSDFQDMIEEVLIVNNRSTDNGEEVVLQYLNSTNKQVKMRLLRNHENYGLGGSHKVAFSYAIENNFDYVIVLHGDDQGNIKDLLPLLNNNVHKKFDCLLGARFQKGSALHGYSWFRTFGNLVYNLLFSIVAGRKIYDLGSGLNCYKVSILRDRFYQKFPDDLTFNYCMILASIYKAHSIRFFPISWREEDQISNVKLFSQAWKVLKMLFGYARDRKGFLTKEHRTRIIAHYGGDIVAKHEVPTYNEEKNELTKSV